MSEEDAIAQAQKWLKESGTSTEKRTPTAALKEFYQVVFPAPAGMLAGDFTVLVDTESEEVVTAIIER